MPTEQEQFNAMVAMGLASLSTLLAVMLEGTQDEETKQLSHELSKFWNEEALNRNAKVEPSNERH